MRSKHCCRWIVVTADSLGRVRHDEAVSGAFPYDPGNSLSKSVARRLKLERRRKLPVIRRTPTRREMCSCCPAAA